MPCHPDAHGQRAGRDGTQRAGGTVRRVRQEGRVGHFLPRQRAAHARDGARRVRGEGGTGELLRPHPAGHRAGSGGVRGGFAGITVDAKTRRRGGLLAK